jgi:hypothetical protein
MKEKTENTEDKLRVWSVGILVLLVISTLILFSITMFRTGNTIVSISSILIAIVILIFGISTLKRQYGEVKKGFPYHDERSNKVMILAGYKAFLISIWWILMIGWASSNDWIQFRDVSQATGMGVGGMAVIFGLCWYYYNRKGDI